MSEILFSVVVDADIEVKRGAEHPDPAERNRLANERQLAEAALGEKE